MQQYDTYLSIEEKRGYKIEIEEYEHVKLSVQLEIGNRTLEKQMG